MKKERLFVVSSRFPPSLHSRLKFIAEARNVTFSEVQREILERGSRAELKKLKR